MKLFKHSLWETYFVNYSYYRSSTAQEPVWKMFKRFPVEPTVQYIHELKQAFIDEDFNQRDILIEIINMWYEIEDLRRDHQMSTAMEFELHKEINNLALLAGITL